MLKKLGAKLKEQKGFTLIELLAVIVILGIIAAIAIPAIGNVINKSEDKATAQDGLQIINAAKMYMANNTTIVVPDGDDGYEIPKANLEEYLDHVKHNTAFTVTVLKGDTSSGSYSYKLTGEHPANPNAADVGIDEQLLVNKTK
jgi:type IV pilus assembly protein PilA